MQHLPTISPTPQLPILTKHAVARSQQRGILREHQETVFAFGDLEHEVGRGCYRLAISQRRLMNLVRNGTISAQIADRCRRLSVITDGMTIVTNYKSSLRAS
ncbi:MAG: hypothetical protein EON58_00390 [Alphaproteobacteria bacterium]|nr:MAG: hypothetical protein EON58_00390 [Alphaproteobacteria bacterium]